MSGFILECLYATGWKRAGDLYWRLADAKAEANKRVRGNARACRVLPVTIEEAEAYSVEQPEARTSVPKAIAS